MADGYTQLIMHRKNLDNLPDLVIPDGFRLRDYRDGDEADWDAIVGEMCGEGFVNAIKNNRLFMPKRVKFICKDDRPAATATAWEGREGPASRGMLHMVATDPVFRGLGLGSAVTNAVLHHMRHEGKTEVFLTTDDYRIHAIKIYDKIGFVPDRSPVGHAARWEAVYRQIMK
jgi:mycothiol synthase